MLVYSLILILYLCQICMIGLYYAQWYQLVLIQRVIVTKLYCNPSNKLYEFHVDLS